MSESPAEHDALRSREGVFWLAVFAVVLLDSLIVYFLKTLTGRVWPVNFAVAILALIGWATFGLRQSLPRGSAVAGLALCVVGFVIGICLLEEFTAYRAVEMTGGLLAFLVGFAAIRNLRHAEDLATMLLAIGALYVIVCLGALYRVAPALLPIIDAIGLDGSELIVRPEVTIDQNFQIYYLFIVALPLVLPQPLVRQLLTLALTAGAVLVLIRLQTRSGILVLGGIVLAGWFALAWQRTPSARRLWLLPAIAIVVATTQLERVLQIAAPLLKRFTGGDFTTLQGRLNSASYFFHHLPDPAYWFPAGNREFLRLGGDVPHFNPAAFLLEGGLLALAGWIIVQLVPLLRLAARFVQRHTDAVAALALLGGIASLITSLSLNAPHFKQGWLWAGAVVGALARTLSSAVEARAEAAQPAGVLPVPRNLMS